MQFNPAKLTEARGNACLSMSALAIKSGVSVSTISYLENGKTLRPRSDIINKLAGALDVDWGIFFEPGFRFPERSA